PGARLAPGQGRSKSSWRDSSAIDSRGQADPFTEINSYSISDLWMMLGLEGEPKPSGCMRSPFRDERTPSFSVFNRGTGWGWKYHGSGELGDGVEVVRVARRTDHACVRDWWLERNGIDQLKHSSIVAPRSFCNQTEARSIEWPAPLFEGT